MLAPNKVRYTVVTSDATGLNIAGGGAFLYGIVNIAAGTMAAVYNSKTAAGDVLIPSSTGSVFFNGLGVYCDQGITADWTSGTWLVIWCEGT